MSWKILVPIVVYDFSDTLKLLLLPSSSLDCFLCFAFFSVSVFLQLHWWWHWSIAWSVIAASEIHHHPIRISLNAIEVGTIYTIRWTIDLRTGRQEVLDKAEKEEVITFGSLPLPLPHFHRPQFKRMSNLLERYIIDQETGSLTTDESLIKCKWNQLIQIGINDELLELH